MATNYYWYSVIDKARGGAGGAYLRQTPSLTDWTELAHGYRYRLIGTGFSVAETGEWIAFERLCCPFLGFGIEAPGGEGDWLVTVTGPEGVKALLRGALMVDLR